MKPDPAIETVRRVRGEISESVGHDPARLVARYIELQERLLHAPTREEGQTTEDAAE